MKTHEFINPNLHVILIHYPLGLLVVGVLIELFAFLWRRSAFRAAGRWMILIGALSLAPTATSGLYAMADVNRPPGSEVDATWAAARQASPVQGEAWEMLTRHAWSNAAGSLVLMLLVVLWIGSSDLWRSRLHLVYLLGLVVGLGILVFGAWYGGEMVYRHGVGVESKYAAGTGVPEGSTDAPGASAAGVETTDWKDNLAYFAPPLQIHVIIAGFTVSLALAALGLSLRAGAQANVTLEPTPELSDIGTALNPRSRAASPIDSGENVAAQLNALDDATVRVDVHRVPAGRWWLLAALVGALSSLSGMWALAHLSGIWDVNELWQQIADTDTYGARRLAHVVAGGGIVALLIVMAIVARVAYARRMVLMIFTLLLVVAFAAQVWLGSLLMFDTQAGPLWEFNGTGAPTTAPATQGVATEPTGSPSPATAPSGEAPAGEAPAGQAPTGEAMTPITSPATIPAPAEAAAAPATSPTTAPE